MLSNRPPGISPAPQVSRRKFLGQAASSLAVSTLFSRLLFAEGVVQIEQPNAGTAGAVWRPLIEKALTQTQTNVKPRWIGGDPGLSQVQLLAGAIDVGFFGPIGAAETDLRGHDVVIFAPGLINHGSWIVKGNSAWRTPESLKGKRIASQPETSETYRQARLAAGLNGLDLKRDFQVIFGPPTANLALFERGDVDAIIAIEPVSSRLIANGAREIARVRDQWKKGTGDERPLFLGGQGCRSDWFEKNRSTAQDLAKLYIDANKQLNANPGLIAEMHEALGIKDADRPTIDLLAKRLPEIYSAEWNPSVANVANKLIDVAVTNGILKGKPARPICEIA
jgi:ABC-type nitrate/sulfonate/bicarbonate transport system substrate-binding protein